MKFSQFLKESFDVSSFVTSEMTADQLTAIYGKDYTDKVKFTKHLYVGMNKTGEAEFLVLIDSSEDRSTEAEDHYIVTRVYVKLRDDGLGMELSGNPIFNSSEEDEAIESFEQPSKKK